MTKFLTLAGVWVKVRLNNWMKEFSFSMSFLDWKWSVFLVEVRIIHSYSDTVLLHFPPIARPLSAFYR